MSSVSKFRDSPTRPHAPPTRPNARASDSDVRKMTGSSHGPGGQAQVHREKIGDHRQSGLHSGSANTSVPPRVNAGKPYRNGPDEAA